MAAGCCNAAAVQRAANTAGRAGIGVCPRVSSPPYEVRRGGQEPMPELGCHTPEVTPRSETVPAPREGEPGRSLAHRDDDGVAPEAEHQPRPLRLQMQDHARLVLQPEIAGTRRAKRKAVAGLAIGARELPEVAEVVDLARRFDGGNANAPDAAPPNVKRIRTTAKGQDATSTATAADVSRLHLVHLDGAVRRFALDRLRADRDTLRTPREGQDARTHERQASQHPLPRMLGHKTSSLVACVGIYPPRLRQGKRSCA